MCVSAIFSRDILESGGTEGVNPAALTASELVLFVIIWETGKASKPTNKNHLQTSAQHGNTFFFFKVGGGGGKGGRKKKELRFE